jgi:hypothetical protein
MKFFASWLLILTTGVVLTVSIFQMRGLPIVVSALAGNPTFRHPTEVICDPNGVVSGVIRNDGDGWYAIDDEGHTPTNIRLIESDARGIVIHFSFEADDIHTFIVGSDETLNLSGITGGASVAIDNARLTLAGTWTFGSIRKSPLWVNTIRFPLSNFWIYGLFKADCD